MTYGGSLAQAGRGTTFAVGATPTTVGEVKSCGEIGGSWTKVATTNLQSSGAEKLSTVFDGGQVELAGNRQAADAGQVAVQAAYESGALLACVLTLPKTAAQTTSGDKFTFNALVTKSTFDVDVEKEISWKCTLDISNGYTFTPGT